MAYHSCKKVPDHMLNKSADQPLEADIRAEVRRLDLEARARVEPESGNQEAKSDVRQINATPTLTAPNGMPCPQVKDKNGRPIAFRCVKVKPSDSVVSVAVRNDVTVSELKRFNRRLIFDFCDNVEYVWLPIKENQVITERIDDSTNKRYYAQKEFLMRTSATKEEATYYLEEHDWDCGAALSNYFEDLQWERRHQHLPHSPLHNPQAATVPQPQYIMPKEQNQQQQQPVLSAPQPVLAQVVQVQYAQPTQVHRRSVTRQQPVQQEPVSVVGLPPAAEIQMTGRYPTLPTRT